jgi:hypothetical protein
MALSDNRGSREFDKFIADGSGDASVRVTSTSSVTTSASAATVTVAATSSTGTVILDNTDVAGKERMGIQMFNVTADGAYTFKVWGTLVATPGSVGGANWTQIGDDIAVAAATPNAYKAISTTPVKSLGVTCYKTGGSGTQTATVYLMAD